MLTTKVMVIIIIEEEQPLNQMNYKTVHVIFPRVSIDVKILTMTPENPYPLFYSYFDTNFSLTL